MRSPSSPVVTTSILLCLLLALGGCSPDQSADTTPRQTSDSPRPALIFTVADAASSRLRQFPARVQAAEEAVLAFRVPGEIREFPVRAGQNLKAGALIASLDPADYQLRLDDRQARFQLVRSQFNRIADLYQHQQVSVSQYDQAKAELDISQAALNSARSDLAYSRLTAPFDGTIAQLLTDNHQTVAAGTPIVRLQAHDQLEVRIQVPEKLMAHLSEASRPYQPEVEFDSLPGQRFKSRYHSHNAVADAATGSYSIELTLPRPANLNLLPGMGATVYADLGQILADQPDWPLVPPQAVFQNDQQPVGSNAASVWVLDANNQLRLRSVRTGQLTADGLEIVEGLSGGEQILAAGVHQARDGMSVTPWRQERGL